MSKPWKIVTTVLIAVVIPPGMAGWFLGYAWLVGLLRKLMWDMAFWGWPNWIGVSINVGVSVAWFVLPWVGVVWLLLKIWQSNAPKRSPRITEGKG